VSLYYPNRFAGDLLLAMEEVMGRHGLDAILASAGLTALSSNPPPNTLDRAFDFAHLSKINAALDDLYGARGGRGMALRTGRAWFALGLIQFGALRGIADPAFRALPLEDRSRVSLKALADIFSNFTDQTSRVEEDANAFRFIVHPSPFAYGRTTDRPVCHPLVGLLQEHQRWASNGREYVVRETQCAASGDDHCVFLINKHAIS
jgi:predicted hydrocarbon binding protein